MSDNRVMRSFTIDAKIAEALVQRSKESGEKMSRLIDQGLRLLLALPPEEREETDDGMAPTRTEKAMLHTITAAGPGWHHGWKLGVDAGVSFKMAEKALKALAREGKVYRWGVNQPFSSGKPGGNCWSLKPAFASAKQLFDSWLAAGGESLGEVKMVAMFVLMRKLCIAIDDVQPIRDLIGTTMRLPCDYDSLGIENYTEREARLWKIERSRTA